MITLLIRTGGMEAELTDLDNVKPILEECDLIHYESRMIIKLLITVKGITQFFKIPSWFCGNLVVLGRP